jgi:hypothetical protein
VFIILPPDGVSQVIAVPHNDSTDEGVVAAKTESVREFP